MKNFVFTDTITKQMYHVKTVLSNFTFKWSQFKVYIDIFFIFLKNTNYYLRSFYRFTFDDQISTHCNSIVEYQDTKIAGT